MSTLRRSPCWCGTPSHHVPVERPARAAHAAATGGTSAAHVLPDPGALPEARTARTQELPVLRVRVTQVHAAPREGRVPAVLPAPQEPREVTQPGRRVAKNLRGAGVGVLQEHLNACQERLKPLRFRTVLRDEISSVRGFAPIGAKLPQSLSLLV